MGNQTVEGIPPLLSKNWLPVPNHPNTFRNRLTHEYTHKHIVKVEEPIEIESFKYRMHENNDYLCRVLYYHEYTDSIYHVYTDQMHIQPEKRQGERWAHDKVKIMETFRNLSELFGFTRVCRQMIGSDTNGNIKIWINPDPISPKAWSPCSSESLMVADILNILQSIQEFQYTKPLNKSYDTRNRTCSSFAQYIREQSKKMVQQKKKIQNTTSTHINNSTTNFNININIELDGKGRPIVKHTPQTPDPLQKKFYPVLCETKRRQQEEEVDYSAFDQAQDYKKPAAKVHRPSTEYPFQKAEKIMTYYRTQNNTKRRDSDFFKQAHLHNQNQSGADTKKISVYPSVGKKHGATPKTSNNTQKNFLAKMLNNSPMSKHTAKVINPPMNLLNKLSSNGESKNSYSRPISNFIGTHRPNPASSKNTTIPNFLAQRVVEASPMKFRTCSSLEKYPESSERARQEGEFLQVNLSPIEKQKHKEYHDEKEEEMSNVMSMIKDELNNILDTPVANEPTVSPSFQNFKAAKALYKSTPTKEQDAEMQQIKEKVQKKKATFAHLKLEAMKILQDDF